MTRMTNWKGESLPFSTALYDRPPADTRPADARALANGPWENTPAVTAGDIVDAAFRQLAGVEARERRELEQPRTPVYAAIIRDALGHAAQIVEQITSAEDEEPQHAHAMSHPGPFGRALTPDEEARLCAELAAERPQYIALQSTDTMPIRVSGSTSVGRQHVSDLLTVAEHDELKSQSIPTGYIRNCSVESRPGEAEPWLFYVHPSGQVVCRLNGYAVVPLEKYEALRAEVERLRGGTQTVYEAVDQGGRQHVSDAAPKAGLSPALRERAERAVGGVRALNFTRAAPDEAVMTHLCEIAERLGRSDMAQLDQENARLRGELVAARIERDNWRADAQRYAGNVDYWRERAEGKPAAGNVTRIEPFPEPAPRSESWPPPSHKPRMLP